MDNFPDDVGWEKSLQLLKEAPPQERRILVSGRLLGKPVVIAEGNVSLLLSRYEERPPPLGPLPQQREVEIVGKVCLWGLTQ